MVVHLHLVQLMTKLQMLTKKLGMLSTLMVLQLVELQQHQWWWGDGMFIYTSPSMGGATAKVAYRNHESDAAEFI